VTRAEVMQLLVAPPTEVVPAKQYEPPSQRVTCVLCGTGFRLMHWEDKNAKSWFAKHTDECAKRSPEERTFYLEHQRWPARKK